MLQEPFKDSKRNKVKSQIHEQKILKTNPLRQFEYKGCSHYTPVSDLSKTVLNKDQDIKVAQLKTKVIIPSDEDRSSIEENIGSDAVNDTTTSLKQFIYENIEEQNHEIQIKKRWEQEERHVPLSCEEVIKEDKASDTLSSLSDEEVREIFGSDVEII